MDKFDFINRIIALYPHAIKDNSAQYDLYNRVLPKNTDFEKLMDVFANEYTESFPPPGAVLKKMALNCTEPENANANFGKWIHVKVYNPIYKTVVNTDCFPTGTTEAQMLHYYKKSFGGDGWQIMELNYA